MTAGNKTNYALDQSPVQSPEGRELSDGGRDRRLLTRCIDEDHPRPRLLVKPSKLDVLEHLNTNTMSVRVSTASRSDEC